MLTFAFTPSLHLPTHHLAKFAVEDGEIPPDQYTYKTDKPFARGGTAAAFIVEFKGEEHCAKVWDLSQVTMAEREKITKTFKRELATNSKLYNEYIVHGE